MTTTHFCENYLKNFQQNQVYVYSFQIFIFQIVTYQQILIVISLFLLSQDLNIQYCKRKQMYEQQVNYFAQQLEQISQIYIKTTYGNIFAHCVGKHGQPLIIVVHGSGPKNSGDEYLYFLHEYLVRVSYIEKFFIISIDCPGYGRSKGSKQAVKTFPLQMFKQILADLGYKSYFAMMGHSQGGAAIFNAVFQQPKLTQFLLMDRPVCGNIKRFSKFPLPTLLIYDIQDDGHPIWQGKLLFKQLQSSQLHTYRNSQNPYWVPDNIWNLVISFFRKYSSQRKTFMNSRVAGPIRHRTLSRQHQIKSKSKQKENTKKQQKHVSMGKCQQIKKERQKSQKSLQLIKQVDRSQIYSKVADLQQFQDLPVWLNQPKIEQTQQQINTQKKKKKQQQQKLKNQIKIQNIEKKEQKTKEENKEKKQPQKKQITSEKEQKLKLQNQQAQDRCSICYQIYYHPLQTNCKHIFCKKCIGQSILVDQRCPLCRVKITKKTFNEQLHNKIVSKMTAADKQKRQKQLNQFEQLVKSIVYVQLGNTSRQLQTKKSAFTKTKKKYVWQLFVKEPKNFKFQQVCFDINMGNRDSVPIKVTHAPFVFESRSTFSFSCQITIKPRNKQYAPLISVYRIDVTPGLHSKTVALKKKKQ